jgi:gas vesicle protein
MNTKGGIATAISIGSGHFQADVVAKATEESPPSPVSIAVNHPEPLFKPTEPRRTAKDVLEDAERFLCEWKELMNDVKVKAEDLYYWSRELRAEEKHGLSAEKLKVFHHKLSVDKFDQDLEALAKRQKPVWDVLLDRSATERARVKMAHAKLVQVHKEIKDMLREDPLCRKYINPMVHLFGKVLSPDQKELCDKYKHKLSRLFEMAEQEFQELCGYPTGNLVQVKLYATNVQKEAARIAERVHQVKESQAPENEVAAQGVEENAAEETAPEHPIDETK